MSKKQSKLSLIAILLAVLGAGFSIISLYHHTMLRYGFGSDGSFCNINAAFNCDLVNQSAWSSIFGVPLASYGLAFFLFVFFFSLIGSSASLIKPATFRGILLLLGFLGTLVSIFFFLVSELEIGSLCLMCLGIYFVNFALFFSAWLVAEETSLSAGLRDGMSAIFKAPKVFLSRGADDESNCALLSAFLVFIPIIGLFSYMLVDYFLVHYFLQIRDPKKQATDYIAQWEKQSEVQIPLTLEGSDRDYQTGNSNAPIKIIEFSDFECPACRRFYTSLEPFLEKYKGKIQITYKNYPLDPACNVTIPRSMHPNACFSAYFARCAGEQGKFWEAADYLFTLPAFNPNNKPEQVNAEILSGIKILSLDDVAMKECISSERVKKKVIADINEGNRLKIPGTPAIWLNGKPLQSNSEEVLDTIFKKLAH